MSTLLKKIRFILVPYIITVLVCCGVYTWLHWWLLVKLELFTVKADFAEFIFPMLLAGTMCLLYLRPRLRKLKLPMRGKQDVPLAYAMVAWIGLCISIGIAQRYMIKETGQLLALENIRHIAKNEKAAYYTLKEHFVYKRAYHVTSEYSIIGKHDEDRKYEIYYVAPILVKEDDTALHSCVGWLGIKYSKIMSNDDAEDLIEKKYDTLWNNSWEDFVARNLDSFTYLERPTNDGDLQSFTNTVQQQTTFSSAEKTILEPVYTSFEARSGDKPKWLWLSLLISFIIFTIMVLLPGIKTDEQYEHQEKTIRRDDLELFFWILPHKNSMVTSMLVYTLLLAYLWMMATCTGVTMFSQADLIKMGGNYWPKILHGEFWRPVTAIFLQSGFMHLISSIVGLMFIGACLEKFLGRKRFVLAFIISGICAGLTNMLWQPDRVSVEASGSVLGLFGVLLALMLFNVYNATYKASYLVAVIIYTAYSMVIGANIPGIDNSAHIGGLVSGFIIGLTFVPYMRRKLAAELVGLEELENTQEDTDPDQ